MQVIETQDLYLVNRLTKVLRGFAATIKRLIALEPVIPNIIAVILCVSAIMLIGHKDILPNIGKCHTYLNTLLQGLAAYQIIRSSAKSLLLPLITISIAIVGLTMIQHAPSLISKNIFQDLVLVGIIGVTITVFKIN